MEDNTLEKKTVRTEVYTYKSKAAAVVLGLFLGGLGAHRFYLGDTFYGVIILICSLALFTTTLVWLVPAIVLIDVIMIALSDKEKFKRLSGYTETTQ